MKNAHIAYCGLDCTTCPIHTATVEPDESKRQQMRINIAQQCLEYYNMKILPEEVTDCDGCRAATGRLFSGCVQCNIRSCASNKKIENCGYCNEYVCDRLAEHFKLDPEAKKRLDAFRSQ